MHAYVCVCRRISGFVCMQGGSQAETVESLAASDSGPVSLEAKIII